jgi:hypothetical protein
MDLAAYGPKEIEDIQFKFASTLYGTSEKPPRYFMMAYCTVMDIDLPRKMSFLNTFEASIIF